MKRLFEHTLVEIITDTKDKKGKITPARDFNEKELVFIARKTDWKDDEAKAIVLEQVEKQMAEKKDVAETINEKILQPVSEEQIKAVEEDSVADDSVKSEEEE